MTALSKARPMSGLALASAFLEHTIWSSDVFNNGKVEPVLGDRWMCLSDPLGFLLRPDRCHHRMASCKEELKNMSSEETASTCRNSLACDRVVSWYVALACEENSGHCIGNKRIL